MEKQPLLFAVSGVKNTGKTTFISKLIPALVAEGKKVATIKHDGHEFEADTPGTDSYIHGQSGAYGTVVFSKSKFMVVKQCPDYPPTAEELQWFFPEADIILLEGFKYSNYPKLEIVRQSISQDSVCMGHNLMAVVSDVVPQGCEQVKHIPLDDIQSVVNLILNLEYVKKELSFLVLAGGQSRRMGRDKADLDYQGQTFLQVQLEKAKTLGIEEVKVSGYRGTTCPVEVIPDQLIERGPLGGLRSSLPRMYHSHCLVLGVDVPGVSVGTLLDLIGQSRVRPDLPVILQHGEKQEPLMGIYPCGLWRQMEEALEQGQGSVFRFLGQCGYTVCLSQAAESEFWNINDPERYGIFLKNM